MYEELSEERKELQAKGKLPDWFTTPGWQMFKKGYLYEADDFKGQAERIANQLSKYRPRRQNKYWFDAYYSLLWRGWLAASTPVLANCGTKRGCSVSCSGVYVPDSIEGFYGSRLECALMTKYGFGTSAFMGDIRPRGAMIATGNKANGPLPEFKAFVQASRDVAQGANTRRGAWAGYLPIDHPDFFEVADYLFNNPDDLNVGWNISDAFIQRLDSGDLDALERYQRAMKIRCVTGKGYLHFIDKVNRQNPQMYKDHNLSVKASNLCVAPETLLLTIDGYKEIQTLENQTVTIWNGEEYTPARVKKTGENQGLLTVTMKSGKKIECTPYHKFYIDLEPEETGEMEVRACDLDEGDTVTFELPEKGIQLEVVESVYNLGRVSDTYCFNEPKRHRGVLSGILTGNCMEIELHSDINHSFTCTLSSLNLAKYDEWKNTDTVRIATHFLDCVAEDFIAQARDLPGLERAIRFTKKSKALGLGALGFHTYLQQKGWAFDSMEAHMWNNQVFSEIKRESLKASQEIAKEFGEPLWCRGYGVAHSHLLAVAPNTSSALICGSVSQGIEPFFENTFTQGSAHGEIIRVNPVLIELLKAKGKYNKKVIEGIAQNNGSVKGLNFLSDHEKSVFATAFEIDPEAILRLASERQRHICQAQSLNLFFDADEKEEYISYIHEKAMRDPRIKGLYYLRSKSGVDVTKNTCIACEG